MSKKKYICLSLFVVLLFILSGCQKAAEGTKPNDQQNNGSDQTQTAVGEPEGIKLYNQAIGYLMSTSEPKAESEQEALVVQMQALKQEQAPSKQIFTLFTENIERLRSPYADEFAFHAISALQGNSFNDTAQFDPYFTEAEGQIAFNKALETAGGSYLMLKRGRAELPDGPLKEQLEAAAQQGYLLASTEGYILPIVDFTEFAKYKALYSQGFGALVDQFAYNAVQMLVNDGGLMTSLEDVAVRMEVSEKAMTAAKGTTYGKFLTLVYTENLRVLLTGAENTPTYAYESMKLTADAKKSLEAVANESQSETGKYVSAFLETLKTSDDVYNDAAFAKIDALIEQVKADNGVTDEDLTDYQHWLSGQSE